MADSLTPDEIVFLRDLEKLEQELIKLDEGQEYIKAEQMKKEIKKHKASYLRKVNEQLESEHVAQLDELHRVHEEVKIELRNRWEHDLAEYDTNSNDMISEMEKRHAEQRQRFKNSAKTKNERLRQFLERKKDITEADIRSPRSPRERMLSSRGNPTDAPSVESREFAQLESSLLRSFRFRPSASLLNMERIQRSLVSQGKYKEASQVKRRADELRAWELDRHEEKYLKTADRLVRRLLQIQRDGKTRLIARIEQGRKQLEVARKKDFTALEQQFKAELSLYEVTYRREKSERLKEAKRLFGMGRMGDRESGAREERRRRAKADREGLGTSSPNATTEFDPDQVSLPWESAHSRLTAYIHDGRTIEGGVEPEAVFVAAGDGVEPRPSPPLASQAAFLLTSPRRTGMGARVSSSPLTGLKLGESTDREETARKAAELRMEMGGE
ncbi:hypothetical protein ADUPG1_009594 [Aduncisulcus paluster]|uniref:Uncharacterized protein n=1 Tax=Aduncisulcus paluster TaxID=2918883 RepID=A0ABQ5KW54_9EUKA|nr:hypothetical protein ADUPG1_009594 [Aduncisulcus paluster]